MDKQSAMSDLVERLHGAVAYGYMPRLMRELATEAADTITRLTAELAQARDKALDEAAEACEYNGVMLSLNGTANATACGIRIAQAIRALRSPPPL